MSDSKSKDAVTSKPKLATARTLLKNTDTSEDSDAVAIAGETPASASSNSSPSASKVKIEPLNADITMGTDQEDSSDATLQPSDSEAAASPDFSSSDDEAAGTPKPKLSAEDEELAARKDAERAQELDTLAISRKYYLPINQIEERRNKRYAIIGAVLIVILGLAWIDIMLDAGIVHVVGIKSPTHFFSTATTTPIKTTESSTLTQTTVNTAAAKALAKTDLESIQTYLEAYFAANGSYPSDIKQSNFAGIPNVQLNPAVFTPPAGFEYSYTPAPTTCTTAAKDCLSYRLSAVLLSNHSTLITFESLS